MRILFAASEATPFSKSGGLADVVGSLAPALVKEGLECAVISPLYRDPYNPGHPSWCDELQAIDEYTVNVGWRQQPCRLFKMQRNGVDYYFVYNAYYFSNRDQLYGYYDDGERFIFFSHAVLGALKAIGPIDVLHCHDWQTAAVPLLLRQPPWGKMYFGLRTVFTIHNLRFQGRFPNSVVHDLMNLPRDAARWQELEYYGDVNLMKAALFYANAITTVSPTYAEEIKTAWYGEGLDPILNLLSYKVHGILNGIDLDTINPMKDPNIRYPFNDLKGKAKNKAAFQKEHGLAVDPDTMLVGVVSRLDAQKGFDLIQRVLDDMLRQKVQFVVLGTQAGEPGAPKSYEDFFRYAEVSHPDQVRSFLFFDAKLAQQIYASCDLFLMPSAFEPCGLSQMMSMRYGTLPLVRETGGLKDTVIPYNQYTGEGDGFSFKNYNAHDMLHVFEWACELFENHRDVWNTLAERAMAKDFSWAKSAKEYINLYDYVLTH